MFDHVRCKHVAQKVKVLELANVAIEHSHTWIQLNAAFRQGYQSPGRNKSRTLQTQYVKQMHIY